MHSEFAPRVDRGTALIFMFEALCKAAEEAPSRDSNGWLRDAAASVANAINDEKRRALT